MAGNNGSTVKQSNDLDVQKTVVVHYDGKWRENPVLGSGWGAIDYIMARSVVLDNVEGDPDSISSLSQRVGKAAPSIKNHEKLYTYLWYGKKKILRTDEDFPRAWTHGEKDHKGRLQLYLDHIPPHRSKKKATSKAGIISISQPEPVLTPCQPTEEVQVHSPEGDTDFVTPEQQHIGSPQTPKTKIRTKMKAAGHLKSPSGRVLTRKRKLYKDGEGNSNGVQTSTEPRVSEPDELVGEVQPSEKEKPEEIRADQIEENEIDEDWLPDPEGMNPEVDEIDLADDYYSGYSSSDYDFDPDRDSGAEDSASETTDLVSDELGSDEDTDVEVVDQQPPSSEFAGVGETMDNLYTEEKHMEPCKKKMKNLDDVLIKRMEWQTLYHCRRALRRHAVLNGFEIHYVKNDKIRVRAKCDKGCSFFFFASKVRGETTFKLRKFVDEHTCGLPGLESNKVVTCRFVAEELEDSIKAHKMKNYKPAHIIEEFWKEFTVDISYWVAWRARTIAMERIFGNYEDGYKKIPELCRQLKLSDPGSLGEFTTLPDEEGKMRFNGLCVGVKAFLEGFSATCRPLVGLDGCFLKGKYGGCCLAATSLDGNNGLYPLAVYICGGEDYNNWFDFLEILAPYIQAHPKTVSFISDRQKGLLDAVADIFEGHPHRYCFRHYYQNFRQKHRGDHLMQLAWGAARSYTKCQYEDFAEQILKVDREAYNWLHREARVDCWARSHFGQEANCEHITNNFSESFNRWILELRELPIVSFVDKFHLMLMSLMFERRNRARKWSLNGLVPRAHKIIDGHKRNMKFYRVHGAHDHLYSVVEYNTVNKWTVDLDKWSCSCNVWDMTGLPCVHGVAVITKVGKPIIGFCSDYHKVSTYLASYQGYVQPMAPMQEWRDPMEECLEPKVFRGAGRPRKERRRAHHEKPKGVVKLRRKCGHCGSLGHNRRTCDKAPKKGPKPRIQHRKPKGKGDPSTSQKVDHTASNLETKPSAGRATKLKIRRPTKSRHMDNA